MTGDGWWWPGFLIQLVLFLTVTLLFTWFLTWWLLERWERRKEADEARRSVGVGDVAGPPVGDSGGGPDE